MTYNEKMLRLYREFVTERHRVWLARQENEPQPWTQDPVIARRSFTNMFRVLDPGSQFVFQLDSKNPVDVLARLVFYRITNRPATWYALRSSLGHYPVADDFVERPGVITGFLNTYRDVGNRVFSGAYIIIPEPGTANDKVEGAVRLTRQFVLWNADDFLAATTQEERFAVLRSTPGLGKFLSMQILTDWGYLQTEEPDLSFVVAGPGARRGAAILNPDIPAEHVIYDMTDQWSDDSLIRVGGRGLTPMDVQNTMCEFSKMYRELMNPRKKTPYKPAHPGAQPHPILPRWW